MSILARARSAFLCDVAYYLVGFALFDPELRVQLAEAWRWNIPPKASGS